MNATRKIVKNADNEDLLPWGNQVAGIVGSVDSVNGLGAEEIPGFIPTRYELLILVTHWYKLQLKNRWFWFLESQVGSSEWRENEYAQRRIERVEELLGYTDVAKILDEVKAEFAKSVNTETWEIFLHGTEEEHRAFAEKSHCIFKAVELIDESLGEGTEAATSMIEFLHRYRNGRSITDILRDPINPGLTAADKESAEKLFSILRDKGLETDHET